AAPRTPRRLRAARAGAQLARHVRELRGAGEGLLRRRACDRRHTPRNGGPVSGVANVRRPSLARPGAPPLDASRVAVRHAGGGAARWLRFGPVRLQPAEVAKVTLVLWLAHSLSKKNEKIRTFSVGFLPHLLVSGVLMLLCLKQPDFGSAVVLLLLTFTLL